MNKYEFVCEQCGKTFINKKNAYRKPKFCSLKCVGKSQRKRIKTTCTFCNKKIEVKENDFNKWEKHYCSKKCRINDGWNTPDKSKKSIFICKWCNKEFEEWTYRQPAFCSRQCMSEFAAKQPKPNARKPENFLEMKCETCGKKYKIHKGVIQNSNRNSRFCSTNCMYSGISNERMGENNPNFVHGLSHLYPGRGKNWSSQRKKALKRDNYTCQVCNNKNKLDVHHITPYVYFNDNWKQANKLSNLITLCRKCHTKVEKGKIPCPLPNS